LNKVHLKEEPLRGVISISFEGDWLTQIAEAWRHNEKNGDFCTHPEKYYFWSQEVNGYTWQADRIHCTSLCDDAAAPHISAADAPHFSCADLRNIFTISGTSCFIPSFLKPIHGNQSHFLPAAEHFNISFEYAFTYEQRAVFDSPSSEYFVSSQNIATYVYDPTEKRHKLLPDKRISFRVKDILMWSGVPDGSLDAPNPLAGMNYAPNAARQGATYRVTGVHIQITIRCFEDQSQLPGYYTIDILNSDRVESCVWRFEKAGTTWSHDITPAHERYGIKISVLMVSRTRFDYNSLFVNLASSITLLAIPNQLIFLIAVYCLGHLSVIYGQGIYNTCSIAHIFRGMSARMLAYGATFERLSDNVHGQGVMTRLQARNRLANILRRHHNKLTGKHLQQMSDFMFDCTVDDHTMMIAEKDAWQSELCCLGRSSFKRPNMKKWATTAMKHAASNNDYGRSVSHENLDSVMNLDHFVNSCTSGNYKLDDLVNLFEDRRTGWLESVFMPTNLKKYSKTLREERREHTNGFDDDQVWRVKVGSLLQFTMQVSYRKTASLDDTKMKHLTDEKAVVRVEEVKEVNGEEWVRTCDGWLPLKCNVDGSRTYVIVAYPRQASLDTSTSMTRVNSRKMSVDPHDQGLCPRGCCPKGHDLTFLWTTQDIGWTCDGKGKNCLGPSAENCGLSRWSCRGCNYDLCRNCLDDFESSGAFGIASTHLPESEGKSLILSQEFSESTEADDLEVRDELAELRRQAEEMMEQAAKMLKRVSILEAAPRDAGPSPRRTLEL
jgi:hypothetical protein